MDDLFSALDESSIVQVEIPPKVTSKPIQISSLDLAPTISTPSTKRTREEEEEDDDKRPFIPVGSVKKNQVYVGVDHSVSGIDAITSSVKLDLDNDRNKYVEEFVASADAEDDVSELASVSKISNNMKLDSTSTEGKGRNVGTSEPNISSSNKEEKKKLERGDVDASKSTAPDDVDAIMSGIVPARKYPFTLDPFQARSIACLERNESVLVSAHTSAGKTVVAEYAIAMALRDKQRVIYTSPIKALSNQKYRDLLEEFGDVGLMTGDVTINPNASCLVMTTEILRSMLYRGSEMTKEVKWVIYDEIHYMRDKERGVVWEESIVLLPHKVRFVFLSATIPNSREFAQWVAKIHHQTCHVVYTDYRPTPLQHFVFPSGGEGVYMVVDEKGRFLEDTFSKAMSVLNASSLENAVDDVVNKGAGKRQKGRAGGSRGQGGPGDLFKIVSLIMERKYNPVIIFSFSKRECESNGTQLAKIDLTTEDEKILIQQVFENALESLSEDDRRLPQIGALLPILKRGVGVHHGGLLPILKEIVEILFQESLIKILCATETFAMGINMPARTVIFTASRKWDGTDFRWISAGEYIQMSGRAGRRGLDDRGIVIQMIDEKMEPAAAKDILKGTADPLNSAFHVGYNMLLNLLRLEGGDPEKMVQLSFRQFQNERMAPVLEARLAEVEDRANTLRQEFAAARAEEVENYYRLCATAAELRARLHRLVMTPQHCIPFLHPGRLVRVTDEEMDWGWGIIVDTQRTVPSQFIIGKAPVEADAASSSTKKRQEEKSEFTVRILLHVSRSTSLNPKFNKQLSSTASSVNSGQKMKRACAPEPASTADVAAGRAEFEPVQCHLSVVRALSSIRMRIPTDLVPRDARQSMSDRLTEVLRRTTPSLNSTANAPKADSKEKEKEKDKEIEQVYLKASPPLLDPVTDMQVSDPAVPTLLTQLAAVQASIEANPVHIREDRDTLFASFRQLEELSAEARELRVRIERCHALVLKDTVRNMKRVLRRLGHLDSENVVQPKGRIACEVNTADELLVTELIFHGVFNDLDAAQTAALLSALVFTEKGSGGEEGRKPPTRVELSQPLLQLKDAARRVAAVFQDCKIEVDPEEYVERFNPAMMELVYAWVKGARFVDICGLSKEFEGTIIRVIRRLEELTRQLADSAKAIGDEGLEAKFNEASVKMRRDIVFAASLYL